MVKPLDYFRQVKSEMKKITWPKRYEVTKLTLVVITFSLIVGIYVGGLDFMFTNLLKLIVEN